MPHRATALVPGLLVGGCSAGRATVAADDGGGDVAPAPTPVPDSTGASQGSAFVRQVWLPTLQPICLACHVTHGLAQQAEARFVLQDASQPGYMEANIAAVAAAGAQRAADGTPWLLAKPSMQVPHGGGLRLDPQGSGYAALAAYLSHAPFDPGCTVTMTPQLLAAVPQRSAPPLATTPTASSTSVTAAAAACRPPTWATRCPPCPCSSGPGRARAARRACSSAAVSAAGSRGCGWYAAGRAAQSAAQIART